MYARTGRKLPQNYDVTPTCDLMEFPLRALTCKIYFSLKSLDKLIKFKIFTVKKFILL